MKVEVHKFGGACFKDFQNVLVAKRNIEELAKTSNLFLVISASFGITTKIKSFLKKMDTLEEINAFCDELLSHHKMLLPKKDQNQVYSILESDLERFKKISIGVLFQGSINQESTDILSTYGERFMCSILQYHLKTSQIIYPEEFLITNSIPSSATIQIEESYQLLTSKKIEGIAIIPGFYGVDITGTVRTLGRSGSDYTGAAIAHISQAESYTIWKMVDGFMTSDPNLVSNCKTIPELSYHEARELSYFGARLIHDKTIDVLMLRNTPLFIRNMLNLDSTTKISNHITLGYKSISCIQNAFMVIIEEPVVSGYESRVSSVLELFEKNSIQIISSSSSYTSIIVVCHKRDRLKISSILANVRYNIIDNISVIAIVGEETSNINNYKQILEVLSENQLYIEHVKFGVNTRLSYLLVSDRTLKPTLSIIHNFIIKV